MCSSMAHLHTDIVCDLPCSAPLCVSATLHSSAWCKPTHGCLAALLLVGVLLQVQVSEAFNVRAKWNLEAHFPDLEG